MGHVLNYNSNPVNELYPIWNHIQYYELYPIWIPKLKLLLI
jgi:hypothetical protein